MNEQKNNMKGFKAFKKGLICRDFHFEENKTFEEESTEICKKGFHFCKNPLDTLDYYDLINSNMEMTEFAEVEALEEPITDDNKKYCTKKIKIGAKLSLGKFINASVNFIKESCEIENIASGDYSQLAASGYSSKLAASGDYSQLAASGDYSQLAASGNSSKLAASGNSSKLAASGNSSKLAASGYSSQLAASGDYSQLAASGYSSKLAASGDYSQLAASGDYSQLAASGYYSIIILDGQESVGANIGIGGIIKGKKGCWITLAEYKDKKPICVKSARIDGKKLKEDTFYKLINGKFVEV